MLSQAQALMVLSRRIKARGCPVAVSQIRTVLSSLPEASQLPSGRHRHRYHRRGCGR